MITNRLKHINRLHNHSIQGKCSFRFNSIIRLDRWYNHYKTLGIDINADEKEIKLAYIALTKKYHPDIKNDKGSTQKYLEINTAYHILSRPKHRTLYDQSIGLPKSILNRPEATEIPPKKTKRARSAANKTNKNNDYSEFTDDTDERTHSEDAEKETHSKVDTNQTVHNFKTPHQNKQNNINSDSHSSPLHRNSSSKTYVTFPKPKAHMNRKTSAKHAGAGINRSTIAHSLYTNKINGEAKEKTQRHGDLVVEISDDPIMTDDMTEHMVEQMEERLRRMGLRFRLRMYLGFAYVMFRIVIYFYK